MGSRHGGRSQKRWIAGPDTSFGLPAADSLRWNVSFRPSVEIVDRCPTTGEESVRVRPARISVSTPRVNIGATYRRPGTALPGPAPPCPVNP